MVYRNSQSHGRPGDGAELEAAYLRVLEDIAARYLDVSEQGAFVVRSEDVITVVGDDGEPLGEVRVRNVLDRGGVAVLSSATSSIFSTLSLDPIFPGLIRTLSAPSCIARIARR